ncbi:hypothetical protein TNCV_1658521 [Trichonephila clavipes]|nr:hypothetical protein TNCV_1658521 [Trichonephila clavipes]
MRTIIVTSLAIKASCLVRSLAMVVEITRLQLSSGMKGFLIGWKVLLLQGISLKLFAKDSATPRQRNFRKWLCNSGTEKFLSNGSAIKTKKFLVNASAIPAQRNSPQMPVQLQEKLRANASATLRQ